MSPKMDKQDNLHPYGLYQAPNAIDYRLNPRAFLALLVHLLASPLSTL